MIRRDPSGASALRYDLIVVGGGIYGVTLALEAARRGRRPLLLERGDFGQATSWNSLRIVHGGLRYLQTLDFRRFRESVGERSWFLRNFPDLVEPLPCLMPLYGRGLKRNAVLRRVLAWNDLLSSRRNEGLRLDRVLPRSRVITAEETVALFPGVRRNGLQGAALWYDAVMPDSQRLIVELLHWACAEGAVALNHVEAVGLLQDGQGIRGLSGQDRLSGERFEFEAGVVVNCSGPWCRELARRFDRDVPQLFRPSLAFNLFIDRAPLSTAALAVAPEPAGSPVYFVHPWKERMLAGTYHAPWSGGPDDGPPGEDSTKSFLSQLRSALPDLAVGPREVLRVHWGLLPAARPGTALLSRRELIHDHGAAGSRRGLYSVSGVKFTTARLVAEKTLRGVFPGETAGPGSPPAPASPPRAEAFRALLARDPAAARAVVERLTRDEAALTVDDLLLRRTDWGVVPAAGSELAARIAPWVAHRT